MVRAFTLLGALALLAACETPDPCEGRGDMLASPRGLELTQAEHAAGWGREECRACHPHDSTHLVNCTSEPTIDMQAVEEQAQEEGCAGCHGSNGLDP